MGPFCLPKVISCLLLTCVASQLTSLRLHHLASAQETSAAAQPADSDAKADSNAAADSNAKSDSDPQASDEAGQADTASAQAEPASSESASGEPAAVEAESNEAEPSEAETEGLPEISKLGYEPHIREIFAAHCSECHGEKSAKADLRVDDREALLGYVEPGDLESSSLWTDYLATTDSEMRMPPPQHGKPLSPMELAAIRVWIEDGAEWPENLEPAAAPEAPAAVTPAPEKNFVQRSWTFVGFFHPAVVHLPIGLLLVSTFFTVMAFVKRETFEPAAFHCLWIGAAGAIAASFAGWAFADIRGYGDFWSTDWDTDLIARHRISGVAVTAAAVLLVLVALLARRRASSDLRFVWLAGALVLAGLVSLVGHQGGELTYGEELFSRAYEQSFGDVQPTSPQTTVVQTAAAKPE